MEDNTIYYLKKDILGNKKIVYFTIFMLIASFGFAIVNFSYGIDDPADIHYLYTNGWGSMIQQGRLGHVLLNKLFGNVKMVPFLNDFLGAFIFAVSAIVFAALFQSVTKGVFSSFSLAVFIGVYLSYSIINEKYIYNLDVVITHISFLCIALALILIYEFIQTKHKLYLILSIPLTIIGISSYESFIFLFIEGFFCIIMFRVICKNEKIKFVHFFVEGLIYAAVLIISTITYYAIVYGVQIYTNQYGLFDRGSVLSSGFSMEVIKNIYTAMTNMDYLPTKEFYLLSIAALVIMIFYGIKRKSIVVILSMLGLYVSNFGIHFVVGNVYYRACQTNTLFVAAIVLLICYFMDKYKWTRVLSIILAGYIMIVQVYDLNYWFYHDYTRYKKEEFAIHSIATRLVAECDVSKPVVFTNRPSSGYLISEAYPSQVNGNSMIYWGVGACGDDAIMTHLFHLHGYEFMITPTPEQVSEGYELSKDLGVWPDKDSIKEFDNIIVVNFDH